MPGDSTFFPPVVYSPLWLVLAAAVILGVVVFYILVTFLTRPTRTPTEDLDLSWLPGADPAALRARYMALIDGIEEQSRAGALGTIDAHQRLSGILRQFAFEHTGLRAPQMTLADLRRTPATDLADAVARLYPASFDGSGAGSVPRAASEAREVVRSWT